MKSLLAAMILALGGALLVPQAASAAPANGAAIANALDATSALDTVACRRVCDWRGCWTSCTRPRAPIYIAPAPIVVPPVIVPAPVCRSVRVCNWRRCWWTRRCW